ncbi:restriction endonuclease subunit S [Thioclava sp.]|uniref:restriction endonuclease subunit S n=1 Tax=Thioclava sp. TaxID=1933450 RepID=UPI003AA8FAAC
MSLELRTLGDHIELVSGPAFKSAQFTENTDDIPLIKGENIAQGYIAWEKSRYWPSSELKKYERFHLHAGDIVLAMDRPWIPAGLKWSEIQERDPLCLLVQRVARLRAGETLHQRFLKYLIASKDFSEYIKNLMGGTNVPHISGKQIKAYRFPLPDLPTQERIAGVLSAYDDLIENNRRRIALLEQAARLLYREWFVHFRFPGSETTKFVDGLPEGWERRPISEIWDISYGKNLPKTKITETGRYPVHGADGIIGYFEKENVSESMCLVTCRGNGSGNVRRTFGPTFVTNNCFVFRPKHKAEGIRFHFAMNACETLKMQDMRTGAAQPQLTLAGISHVNSIVPEDDALQFYNEIADPIWSEADNLRRQNNKLAKARDLLLPRLMDGRLPIPE